MPRVTMATLRDLIRSLSYSVSVHATDELDDDNLSILDLESIVLSGTIVERQRDQSSRETKYVVHGTTLTGEQAECVVKIGPAGRLFVITVYLD
jgi:Domain of unknown function (DUF4258)